MLQKLSLYKIYNAGQKGNKEVLNVIASIKIYVIILSFRKLSYKQILWKFLLSAVTFSLRCTRQSFPA